MVNHLGGLPLAVQLVAPALREVSARSILDDFDEWLPRLVDPDEPGRNVGLIASLDASIRALSEDERSSLDGLAPFDSGAYEDDLLALDDPGRPRRAALRSALLRVGLARLDSPGGPSSPRFLRFHPALTPSLRGRPGGGQPRAAAAHAAHYRSLADVLNALDTTDPATARARVLADLPNYRRAFRTLVASDPAAAAALLNRLRRFLQIAGRGLEIDALTRRLEAAQVAAGAVGPLQETDWEWAMTLGRADLDNGRHVEALDRFETLLRRVEAASTDIGVGPRSIAHADTLHAAARCLECLERPAEALEHLALAHGIVEERIRRQPVDPEPGLIARRGALLMDLGDVFAARGDDDSAGALWQQALAVARWRDDPRAQAQVLERYARLLAGQGDLGRAAGAYATAADFYEGQGEPEMRRHPPLSYWPDRRAGRRRDRGGVRLPHEPGALGGPPEGVGGGPLLPRAGRTGRERGSRRRGRSLVPAGRRPGIRTEVEPGAALRPPVRCGLRRPASRSSAGLRRRRCRFRTPGDPPIPFLAGRATTAGLRRSRRSRVLKNACRILLLATAVVLTHPAEAPAQGRIARAARKAWETAAVAEKGAKEVAGTVGRAAHLAPELAEVSTALRNETRLLRELGAAGLAGRAGQPEGILELVARVSREGQFPQSAAVQRDELAHAFLDLLLERRLAGDSLGADIGIRRLAKVVDGYGTEVRERVAAFGAEVQAEVAALASESIGKARSLDHWDEVGTIARTTRRGGDVPDSYLRIMEDLERLAGEQELLQSLRSFLTRTSGDPSLWRKVGKPFTQDLLTLKDDVVGLYDLTVALQVPATASPPVQSLLNAFAVAERRGLAPEVLQPCQLKLSVKSFLDGSPADARKLLPREAPEELAAGLA